MFQFQASFRFTKHLSILLTLFYIYPTTAAVLNEENYVKQKGVQINKVKILNHNEWYLELTEVPLHDFMPISSEQCQLDDEERKTLIVPEGKLKFYYGNNNATPSCQIFDGQIVSYTKKSYTTQTAISYRSITPDRSTPTYATASPVVLQAQNAFNTNRQVPSQVVVYPATPFIQPDIQLDIQPDIHEHIDKLKTQLDEKEHRFKRANYRLSQKHGETAFLEYQVNIEKSQREKSDRNKRMLENEISKLKEEISTLTETLNKFQQSSQVETSQKHEKDDTQQPPSTIFSHHTKNKATPADTKTIAARPKHFKAPPTQREKQTTKKAHHEKNKDNKEITLPETSTETTLNKEMLNFFLESLKNNKGRLMTATATTLAIICAYYLEIPIDDAINYSLFTVQQTMKDLYAITTHYGDEALKVAEATIKNELLCFFTLPISVYSYVTRTKDPASTHHIHSGTLLFCMSMASLFKLLQSLSFEGFLTSAGCNTFAWLHAYGYVPNVRAVDLDNMRSLPPNTDSSLMAEATRRIPLANASCAELKIINRFTTGRKKKEVRKALKVCGISDDKQRMATCYRKNRAFDGIPEVRNRYTSMRTTEEIRCKKAHQDGHSCITQRVISYTDDALIDYQLCCVNADGECFIPEPLDNETPNNLISITFGFKEAGNYILERRMSVWVGKHTFNVEVLDNDGHLESKAEKFGTIPRQGVFRLYFDNHKPIADYCITNGKVSVFDYVPELAPEITVHPKESARPEKCHKRSQFLQRTRQVKNTCPTRKQPMTKKSQFSSKRSDPRKRTFTPGRSGHVRRYNNNAFGKVR